MRSFVRDTRRPSASIVRVCAETSVRLLQLALNCGHESVPHLQRIGVYIACRVTKIFGCDSEGGNRVVVLLLRAGFSNEEEVD